MTALSRSWRTYSPTELGLLNILRHRLCYSHAFRCKKRPYRKQWLSSNDRCMQVFTQWRELHVSSAKLSNNNTKEASSSVTLTLPNGVSYQQPTKLFVDNKFVDAQGSDKIDVMDPSTEKTITTVQAASERDVDLAVRAARQAFRGKWSELAATERGSFLFKLAELIDRDRSLIAAIDAWDNGKPYTATLTGDLEESYNVFKYYGGFADKIYGKTIETDPNKLAYVVQEPIGVCAQIIPWNYPFMMLAWKIAPALACGNTVVLKPAEQTPLSALYFGKLVQEADLPAGVVNILSGYGNVAGAALAQHMDVDKVAFTGSTSTGRAVMKAASSNLKNVTLECGGKSPSIVFADADLEQAVKWTHEGIMSFGGQVCTATSRIYVEQSIYEKFTEMFVKYSKESIVMGNQFAAETTHGPLITKQQLDKILNYIERGKSDGARLLSQNTESVNAVGYFCQPYIFGDVSEEMSIMKEEIFGPVVAIAPFKTTEEVIQKANNTVYGLAAALFTSDITRAHRVAAKLQVGMVWINSSNDSHFGIPFGGYKSSGIGRELGPYAIDAYTQSKAIHVNLGNRL